MSTEPHAASEDEQAALWVAHHLSHTVDATAFQQWLEGDPARRARFDALWATCMDDAVTQGLQLHERDALFLPDNDNVPETAKPRRRLPRLALAASVALVVGSMALAWPQVRFWITPEQDYTTGSGEVRTVTLADGSQVTLNGRSRLSVRIADDRRSVRLEAGEALFDVTHDAQRPFTVTAEDGTITVLGTRFDVALNDDVVDLQVERGLVRFESSQPGIPAIEVPAHHRASLANGRLGQPVKSDARTPSAWAEGWLEVSDMPFSELIPRLERWSDKAIEVEAPGLLRTKVAGRFQLKDPRDVLENLGVLYGFRVLDTGKAYVLDPN